MSDMACESELRKWLMQKLRQYSSNDFQLNLRMYTTEKYATYEIWSPMLEQFFTNEINISPILSKYRFMRYFIPYFMSHYLEYGNTCKTLKLSAKYFQEKR